MFCFMVLFCVAFEARLCDSVNGLFNVFAKLVIFNNDIK